LEEMRDRKKINGAEGNIYIFLFILRKIKSLSKESFLSAILNPFPTTFSLYQNRSFLYSLEHWLLRSETNTSTFWKYVLILHIVTGHFPVCVVRTCNKRCLNYEVEFPHKKSRHFNKNLLKLPDIKSTINRE
jgi:hypothetical protein